MRERRAAKKEREALAAAAQEKNVLREARRLLERARTSIAMRSDVGGAVRRDIEQFLERRDVAA
jgi:hypothetical protein